MCNKFEVITLKIDIFCLLAVNPFLGTRIINNLDHTLV